MEKSQKQQLKHSLPIQTAARMTSTMRAMEELSRSAVGCGTHAVPRMRRSDDDPFPAENNPPRHGRAVGALDSSSTRSCRSDDETFKLSLVRNNDRTGGPKRPTRRHATIDRPSPTDHLLSVYKAAADARIQPLFDDNEFARKESDEITVVTNTVSGRRSRRYNATTDDDDTKVNANGDTSNTISENNAMFSKTNSSRRRRRPARRRATVDYVAPTMMEGLQSLYKAAADLKVRPLFDGNGDENATEHAEDLAVWPPGDDEGALDIGIPKKPRRATVDRTGGRISPFSGEGANEGIARFSCFDGRGTAAAAKRAKSDGEDGGGARKPVTGGGTRRPARRTTVDCSSCPMENLMRSFKEEADNKVSPFWLEEDEAIVVAESLGEEVRTVRDDDDDPPASPESADGSAISNGSREDAVDVSERTCLASDMYSSLFDRPPLPGSPESIERQQVPSDGSERTCFTSTSSLESLSVHHGAVANGVARMPGLSRGWQQQQQQRFCWTSSGTLCRYERHGGSMPRRGESPERLWCSTMKDLQALRPGASLSRRMASPGHEDRRMQR